MTDTECYHQALQEWRDQHPTVRECDITMLDRSTILLRAQEIKDGLNSIKMTASDFEDMRPENND